MAASDRFRAGEGAAIDWIAGRSEMSDDLGFLVSSMEWPLDEEARAFLLTVGNAAQAAAKRAEQAAKEAASRRTEQTPAASQAPTPVGWEELRRRRREQALRERLDQLWRANAQIPLDAGVRTRGRPGDW